MNFESQKRNTSHFVKEYPASIYRLRFMQRRGVSRRAARRAASEEQNKKLRLSFCSSLTYSSTPLRGRSVPEGRARTSDLLSRSTLCVASARLRVLKKVLSFGRVKQKTSSFVLLFSHLFVPLTCCRRYFRSEEQNKKLRLSFCSSLTYSYLCRRIRKNH